jgi:GNAT superfamily N-acetyltransferase
MEIRKAQLGDAEAILGLIKELAIYENQPNAVINTVDQLNEDLFDRKICDVLVCIIDEQIIGFALYYTSYSTWRGECIYLEDLYVQEAHRRSGAGSLLFDEIVNIAQSRGCKRLDWQVLDWNEMAIEFYKKKNAELDGEWLNGRLYFN